MKHSHLENLVLFCSRLFLLSLPILTGCEDENVDSMQLVSSSYQIYNGETVTPENDRPWSTAVAYLYGCTGLLISPHLVLTADHCGFQQTAFFYTRSDAEEGGGATAEYVTTIDSYENSLADIELRVLDDVPQEVDPYWKIVDYRNNSLVNETVEIAGYGGTGTTLTQGTNCSIYADVYANNGNPTDLRFMYDCESPFSDTNGQGGDSGAPVVLNSGELVGVHTNSPGDLGLGQYLGYTEIDGSKPYIDWILSIMEIEDPEFYAKINVPKWLVPIIS